MKLPPNPLVREVFTWVWLREIGDRVGREVTLSDVPGELWDDLAQPGVDAVWLMGVWRRSSMGARIAASEVSMTEAHHAALADLTADDVVGSAYCIRQYVADERLGGEEGLLAARRELAERGVGLVLDFVPNHLAPDHPWVEEHPEYFVHGTIEDLAREPTAFLEVSGQILACGREPYFPAWPEVVQLDVARGDVRAAAASVLSSIAQRCDAARCDMAMLVLDDVFARTWEGRVAPPPDDRGYWPTVIAEVRRRHPDFELWAEAYWDLEPVLVSQGFDACYDKRLYDRLIHRSGAASIRDHLRADVRYQAHTVRFTENHDEPRLAGVCESAPARAATLVALSLPGVALLHEGQEVGRRVRVPVTLGRRPSEPPDTELTAWYDRLLAAMATGIRRGRWTLLEVDGRRDNESADHLVAWSWTGPGTWLVVVNLSADRADGRVRLANLGSLPDVGEGEIRLLDLLTGAVYERSWSEIEADGLYVGLDGHGQHLLQIVDRP